MKVCWSCSAINHSYTSQGKEVKRETKVNYARFIGKSSKWMTKWISARRRGAPIFDKHLMSHIPWHNLVTQSHSIVFFNRKHVLFSWEIHLEYCMSRSWRQKGFSIRITSQNLCEEESLDCVYLRIVSRRGTGWRCCSCIHYFVTITSLQEDYAWRFVRIFIFIVKE